MTWVLLPAELEPFAILPVWKFFGFFECTQSFICPFHIPYVRVCVSVCSCICL